jgi:hypothetical protein
MLITDLNVKKMDKSDPRYPDVSELPPVSDVYVCTVTMADGKAFEAAFFVMPERTGEMTPQLAMRMMAIFSEVVSRVGNSEAA